MNTLICSKDVSQAVLDLLEVSAREAQVCVQILVANIGKPDPYILLDRHSKAYRASCQANESTADKICMTYFSHPVQNKDLGYLSKSLSQIPQALRTLSHKSFLFASHIELAELSAQTNLLQRISDTTTEMIVAFCRHTSIEKMIARKNSLRMQEEEADKLTQRRISEALRNTFDPLKTIITLSLCNSMREVMDACLNAGNSVFDIHLKYA